MQQQLNYQNKFNSIVGSTIILLVVFAFARVATSGETPSKFLQAPAYIIGLGILAAMLFETTQGVRSVIRADWVALVSFYVLTLSEFLFPQPQFDGRVTMQEIGDGLELCLIGFAALAIGRCFAYLSDRNDSRIRIEPIPIVGLCFVFWVCVFFAYLAPMIAVRFDPLLLIDEVLGPRFAVAWQRERIGGWSSIVYEMGLLGFAIPVLGAALLNLRDRVGPIHLSLILGATLFTLFFSFCSGTRNTFAAQLAGFVGTYLLTHRHLSFWRVAVVGAASVLVMFFAAKTMLEFRDTGLRNYISAAASHEGLKTIPSGPAQQELFVDHNLWSISMLRKKFPAEYKFLGMELLWHALTKPIPRAIWPDKPIRLSTSIEQALGHSDMTISATFVGESYITFGIPAVIVVGLFVGWLCGFWNHVGYVSQHPFGQIVFASGFGAIAICMRSLIFFTTALLPTLALIFFGLMLRKYLLVKSGPARQYSHY